LFNRFRSDPFVEHTEEISVGKLRFRVGGILDPNIIFNFLIMLAISNDHSD